MLQVFVPVWTLHAALKHLCGHAAITNSEEANGPSSGFIFLCSKHKPLAKVNTCVLKSAPGLGVIGTRASFTESSSSVREAYIETQRCRYFEGTRHPQIASPSASLWLPFFLYPRMLSEFNSCSIFPVALSQGLSQMHYFHWGQRCSQALGVISGCWENQLSSGVERKLMSFLIQSCFSFSVFSKFCIMGESGFVEDFSFGELSYWFVLLCNHPIIFSVQRITQ